MTERERFEAWVIQTYHSLPTNEFLLAWSAWQAARNLDVPDEVQEAADRYTCFNEQTQHKDFVVLAGFAMALIIKEQSQ